MASASLTATQIAALRAALQAKREELRRTIAAHARPAADVERPIEDLDLAERDIEESDSAILAERAHRLLGAVEQALARMDAGTYGVSEVSGEPIPFARLQAVPWARANPEDQ